MTTLHNALTAITDQNLTFTNITCAGFCDADSFQLNGQTILDSSGNLIVNRSRYRSNLNVYFLADKDDNIECCTSCSQSTQNIKSNNSTSTEVLSLTSKRL